MGGEQQKNIRVVVRVRPNNRRELEQNQRSIIKVIDETNLLFDPEQDEDEFFFQGIKQTHRDITKRVNKKLSMEFDKVFGHESNNMEIFENCTKPLVESVMNGYNCSVFVYGATGAGKTFTMLGSEDYPGITFLTMRELFNRIDQLKETRKFEIGISYLEVYNELVQNLLTKSGPLKLREDANGVVVSGLVLKPIHDADELLNLLVTGNKHRTQHPTDANAESSRSHAIFQVHIRMTEKKTGQKRTVKLSMIDLAGSERAASTKGIGVRFKEGASINKSLLALGNCINKLADGMKHIPYRDSNLTRILKDSLGGNCQTLMIANISPSSLTYEDTYNTLKYASRAKKIRTTVRQNIMKTNMPKDYYIKKVHDLINERDKLKEQLTRRELEQTDLQSWYNKIDALNSTLLAKKYHYFAVQSEEKVIKTKINFQKYVDDATLSLCLEGLNVNHDLTNFETTVSQLRMKFDEVVLERIEALKQYEETLDTWKKLQKEVQDTNSVVLQFYIKTKDLERENSDHLQRGEHTTQMYGIYRHYSLDLAQWKNLITEVINATYPLLSKNNLLDYELNEKFKNLLNAQIPKLSVGFPEENTLYRTFTDDLELGNTNSDGSLDQKTGKRKLEEYKAEGNNGKKKHILNGFDVELQNRTTSKTVFKFPMPTIGLPMRNLNKPDAIEVAMPETMNETFAITAEKNSSGKMEKDLLNNILTEQNVNAKNRAGISKALAKGGVTARDIRNKVAVVLNKENKKLIASKIRKSPRQTPRNLTNKALYQAANFLNRQRTKSSTPSKKDLETPSRPRINRTASMRIKTNK